MMVEKGDRSRLSNRDGLRPDPIDTLLPDILPSTSDSTWSMETLT